MPSACALRSGSGCKGGGTGCGAGVACSDSAGGGVPIALGCAISTGAVFGSVIGGKGAATGCGFSATACLVGATTGVALRVAPAAAARRLLVPPSRLHAWHALSALVLPRCVGPCSFGGTPRIWWRRRRWLRFLLDQASPATHCLSAPAAAVAIRTARPSIMPNRKIRCTSNAPSNPATFSRRSRGLSRTLAPIDDRPSRRIAWRLDQDDRFGLGWWPRRRWRHDASVTGEAEFLDVRPASRLHC